VPEPIRPADAATGRGEVTVLEPTRAQQQHARRVAESRATVPDVTLATDADMTAAVQLRARLRDAAGAGAPVPTLNDLVVKAAALALREHPRVNGSYRDGRFELYGRVNVGVAVATDAAPVTPTVFDADAKPLERVAAETRALAARARAGEITQPELSAGTFTVSNLGMLGVTAFAAVIAPPQAAVLAVGAVRKDGAMALTISCDHRILYGADAARFLATVRAALEAPEALTGRR
jgi:pyruvate dehydrogenase E2 component (dihydrolipoamide acetyltransferase)